MPVSWIILIIAALMVVGYEMARRRALASAGGDQRALHSLPRTYGTNAALAASVPALGLLAVWLIVQPLAVDYFVSQDLPEDIRAVAGERSLAMADVRRVAEGLDEAVAQGAMTAEEADGLTTDIEALRERLGAAGVILGSDTDETTLALAQDARDLSATGNILRTIVVLLVAFGSGAMIDIFSTHGGPAKAGYVLPKPEKTEGQGETTRAS